jgi:glycosyltransferase involved in cell wall biosynthesis
MRVLWFSNAVLTLEPTKATGTWLFSMSEALVDRGVELYNITQDIRTRDIKKQKVGSITQWILPTYRLRHGLPKREYIDCICNIVNEINPDVIHIWGMESYWGLLSARGYIHGNILLEIQGIKETCVRVFYGGLKKSELMRTIGVKEIIMPSSSLFALRKDFSKWSKIEHELLSSHNHISTHSDWVRAWISQFINKDCHIHYTQRIVRKEFLESERWEKPQNPREAPVIFTMSSGSDAYKGIHDGIRAVAILKKYYPKVQLRIAGNFGIGREFYRISGYTKFLIRLIKSLGLESNVVFLGSLDAKGILTQIHQSDAMLQTSYVESYSLAVAEAMMAGVPLVVSYAGAMPELARDKESALFYTPSDFFTCAYQLRKIFESTELSNQLSSKAREIAESRNVASKLGDLQIAIYKEVMKKEL